jgi:hypothetical protein
MAQLPLTNVITISVSQAQTGVGNYNTSNLAIFTDEVPAMSFGSAGFSSYLAPTQVGIDFGTTSKTYAMANAVFSQQPNILTGGGQLVVILLHAAVQTLALSGIAASGVFVLNYNSNPTTAINWNDTAAQIQAKLQAVAGLAQATVTGSIASQSLFVTMGGVYGAAALLSVSGATIQTAGSVAVTVTPTTTTPGETIGAAITRTQSLVQYFGITVNEALDVIGQTDLLAAAAIVQALNKIAFFVSHTQADIATAGMIDLMRSGSLTQTRGLYYGDTSDLNDIVFMASYAGRALSTNFTGSNTTQTMHLKALSGVQPDPTITQSILNTAIAAGADTYISLQGVSSVFCSGANTFYDRVYNLQWFVGALQVAGFNYLATTSTKVPQTEAGMDGLKGAYRSVCEQGITNQYGAPGAWNSPTVFGNPADLILNVGQRGYYIYSTPIAQQSQTNRVARQAPLVQIAFKEAGAIQSSTVIVNVNA